MLRIGSIVWGVRDVPAAVRFWTRALGYRPRYEPEGDWVLLEPATGWGVQLALQEVKADSASRRRHHLDLYAVDQATEVARLEALGATRVDWRYEDDADYVVMSDPDGNLFCVIEAGDAALDPLTRLMATGAVTPLHSPAQVAGETPPSDAFEYRGARALAILHENHLREFMPIWRAARASGVPLPKSTDENYASYEALLRHVLRAAGRYLTWMCKNLGLEDPKVSEAPPVERIAAEADDYLEHVVERWRLPLRRLPESRFEDESYTSNWGVPMTIESMLEHAVMHPIRHAFQLRELLARRG
ncbi:MAG TPA: VOC family protein [Trueperaceae bacterium]|nr:VOC family protein [Trueperaceae bacterium]